jgi:hypothetical protein
MVNLKSINYNYFLDYCSFKCLGKFLLFTTCLTNTETKLIEECDVTPYGTIVVDFIKNDNLVSVEIGDNDIGFFTDFKNNEDFELDKEYFTGYTLPKLLIKALNTLIKL